MVTENSAQNLHEAFVPQGPTAQIKIITSHSDNSSGEDHEVVLSNLLQRQSLDEKIEINEKITEIVESYGYPKEWLLKSLNQHELNYATTAYLLLHF